MNSLSIFGRKGSSIAFFLGSISRKQLSSSCCYYSIRRNYSASGSGNNNNDVEVEEVKIPVPWGHIAGRFWHPSPSSPQDRKPVLCLHGWKDNAATFDTLLPLLVPELPKYQFLAIDLPGHGRSSHFPPGMIYSVQDMWVLIFRILRHYDWKKVNLMAHSMGAQISFSYCGTHTKIVEKMVAIDAISPVVLSKEETLGIIPKLTCDILKFEDKLGHGSRPTYTYDEIVQKLMKTHVGALSPEDCKVLMTRGVEECPKGSGRFSFTHDIRVHFLPITGISSRQVQYIARNFRSDVLHLKANDGVNYTIPHIKTRMEQWLSHTEEGEPKGNLVRFMEVEGNHHLHLSNPKSVLPYIVRFMNYDRQMPLVSHHEY